MRASVRPRPKRSGESKFRLFYLGNDPELIGALKKALGEADYRLISCSDRESSIMFLNSEIPYDLLLIDFEWRDGEGLKVARSHIRSATANVCRSFSLRQLNQAAN